jgi:hypothetical protein
MEGANERRTGKDISMRKYQNIKKGGTIGTAFFDYHYSLV